MEMRMLRAAIVGCGKIADDHCSQIQRIRECEIVGACDRELLMAKQLSERFPIKAYFGDLNVMLTESQPDVVHVCTPPESHFSIAKQCLDAGCHVYVEKPFSLCLDDARTLISLAARQGLKVTAGHDDQFRHVARRMRSLVQEGFLGGPPIHMESYYCYEFGGSGYAKGVLADRQHWVRKLPGKLLHNIISHGIARIAEFIAGDSPEVITYGFVSPALRNTGETELIDELRVIISDAGHTTAYFTFSSQMRPSLHQFRIYGRKNGLILDQDQETLIKLRGKMYVSFAEKFIPPISFARQYLGNVYHNVRTFLARDFQMKSGMKFLIESFYKSIEDDTSVPIPYREILLTAQIMDQIFGQLNSEHQQAKFPFASVAVSCSDRSMPFFEKTANQ
jgi:predicted dehydrogenase